MDHPTCDRDTTYWPSGTHCLGMAWSAAVGSLLYFQVGSLNTVSAWESTTKPLFFDNITIFSVRVLLFILLKINLRCEIIVASMPCSLGSLESKL